jgi:hypothetical protein
MNGPACGGQDREVAGHGDEHDDRERGRVGVHQPRSLTHPCTFRRSAGAPRALRVASDAAAHHEAVLGAMASQMLAARTTVAAHRRCRDRPAIAEPAGHHRAQQFPDRWGDLRGERQLPARVDEPDLGVVPGISARCGRAVVAHARVRPSAGGRVVRGPAAPRMLTVDGSPMRTARDTEPGFGSMSRKTPPPPW